MPLKCHQEKYLPDARTDTKMVLLIEDLGDYKCYKLGGEYLPQEATLVVVRMIARMHAMYWNKTMPVHSHF